MSKRDVFIKEIKEAINTGLVLSEDAKNYFDALCITKENDKPQFTENEWRWYPWHILWTEQIFFKMPIKT